MEKNKKPKIPKYAGGYDETGELDEIDFQLGLFEAYMSMGYLGIFSDMATMTLTTLCDDAAGIKSDPDCVPIDVALRYIYEAEGKEAEKE